MATGPTITAKFLADTSQLTSEVDKAASKSGSKLDSFAKNAALALGGAFVVDKLVDFGKASVDAAAADAEAQSKLAAALKSTTGATDSQVAAAESFISNLSKSAAIADDDLRPALATLARGFGDTEKAQNALSIATDVSAGTGKDLSTVTEAMMKAAQGNTGALGRLGVATKDASGNALTLDQIMANMSKTFKGQASTAAESTAGQIRSAKIAMGEMQEQIGSALLPVIGALATFLTATLFPALSKTFGWIMDNKDVVIAAIIGIGAVLLPMFISWAASAAVAAAATLAAAAPFIAIGAVIAGVAYLIIHNWDTIKAATEAVWDAILGAVQFVWNWIKDNWPLLLAILTGPFGIAVKLIVDNWDTIKNAAKVVWDWISANWPLLLAILTGPFGTAALLIKNNWDTIKGAGQAVWDWINSTWQKIEGLLKAPVQAAADAISGLIDGIKHSVTSIVDAIKGPINAVIRAWNGLEFRIPSIKLPSFGGLSVAGQTVIPGWEGPTIGGNTIGFPNIPTLATGGMITADGLVYAHAAEVIAPIDKVGLGGPAVLIEHATFASEVDVDVLMDRVAWAVRTRSA